eukprot:TRINITY_DN9080_c0_g4_i1.p2 TRINITY_DN9080_c0_g4~~TRINITY_DN9080_c0_g4_i1.p2  ORF type:complete len:197 (+),score=26.29 TRINITY_DN9080_c0_g4_i1:575-1165(+)
MEACAGPRPPVFAAQAQAQEVVGYAKVAPSNHPLRRLYALPRPRSRRHSHQEIGGAAGLPMSNSDRTRAIQFRHMPVVWGAHTGGGDEFGHRNRVCRNEDCAPAQAAEGGVAVIDRDTNARANLGMRGVYATCGVDDIIPGYVPADQEEEEDTEEEESDEEDDNEGDRHGGFVCGTAAAVHVTSHSCKSSRHRGSL